MKSKILRWEWAVLGAVILVLATVGLVSRGSAAPAQALENQPAAQAGDPGTKPTADHSQFEALQGPFATGPEVTKACLSCHTEAAEQIMATKHWTWEYVNEDTGDVLGKKNIINNYCVAIDTNEPRCTSCHIGYGWKDKTFDFSVQENVDCLVCHDTTGKYKKFPAGAGHPVYEPTEFPAGSGKIWEPVDLAMVAQNIGPTSRQTCGSCHFYGGGADAVKHGDLDSSMAMPDNSLDVHMDASGLNFSCTACHTTSGHDVAGSRYNTVAKDPNGLDLPVDDGSRATCESCHGLDPMQNAKLNEHVDKVACQTCHVPEFARVLSTKMSWDWSTAGQKNAEGKNFQQKSETGEVIYDTQKGNFTWEKNVVPVYIWFNGIVDYTERGEAVDPAEVIQINQLQGSPDDPDARIWPIKSFQGKQPYDPVNQILVVPHLFGKDDNAYWKSYDWGKAITAGMEYAGLPYSGEFAFEETEMQWPITHMVAPAEDALGCKSCHSQDGRLAGLEGVYMPGRDNSGKAESAAWAVAALALGGVFIHGTARVLNQRKNGKK